MKFGPKLQYSSLWDAMLKNFPSIALNEIDSVDPQSCFISNSYTFYSNKYILKRVHMNLNVCNTTYVITNYLERESGYK